MWVGPIVCARCGTSSWRPRWPSPSSFFFGRGSVAVDVAGVACSTMTIKPSRRRQLSSVSGALHLLDALEAAYRWDANASQQAPQRPRVDVSRDYLVTRAAASLFSTSRDRTEAGTRDRVKPRNRGAAQADNKLGPTSATRHGVRGTTRAKPGASEHTWTLPSRRFDDDDAVAASFVVA